MSQYYVKCPICGDHLDPGEHCDCKERRENELKRRLGLNHRISEMLEDESWNQEELELYC